jgi:Ca2+/Na+ antiporter
MKKHLINFMLTASILLIGFAILKMARVHHQTVYLLCVAIFLIAYLLVLLFINNKRKKG